ncbi:hypothetical protein [Fischerella sp. PCC 9605]|uniref:hypothetical protein n=1 Tax=Fischerella sp. PCC 9605 TaxID=1173024 RepID=UPI00047AF960|nr:hypothetical protein [Fischerella sp. PCC 9605]
MAYQDNTTGGCRESRISAILPDDDDDETLEGVWIEPAQGKSSAEPEQLDYGYVPVVLGYNHSKTPNQLLADLYEKTGESPLLPSTPALPVKADGSRHLRSPAQVLRSFQIKLGDGSESIFPNRSDFEIVSYRGQRMTVAEAKHLHEQELDNNQQMKTLLNPRKQALAEQQQRLAEENQHKLGNPQSNQLMQGIDLASPEQLQHLAEKVGFLDAIAALQQQVSDLTAKLEERRDA